MQFCTTNPQKAARSGNKCANRSLWSRLSYGLGGGIKQMRSLCRCAHPARPSAISATTQIAELSRDQRERLAHISLALAAVLRCGVRFRTAASQAAQRFGTILMGILRELSDESAYCRHLAAHGRAHSAAEWRRFSDHRLHAKYIRPKCC